MDSKPRCVKCGSVRIEHSKGTDSYCRHCCDRYKDAHAKTEDSGSLDSPDIMESGFVIIQAILAGLLAMLKAIPVATIFSGMVIGVSAWQGDTITWDLVRRWTSNVFLIVLGFAWPWGMAGLLGFTWKSSGLKLARKLFMSVQVLVSAAIGGIAMIYVWDLFSLRNPLHHWNSYTELILSGAGIGVFLVVLFAVVANHEAAGGRLG